MWSKIDSESDIIDFMRIVNDQSDSCIKEIKYVSGGYVSENLGMHAVNTKRNLYIYIFRVNIAKYRLLNYYLRE